jgi:hypothetical protein
MSACRLYPITVSRAKCARPAVTTSRPAQQRHFFLHSARVSQSSVSPEKLLRALLLQVLCTCGNARLLRAEKFEHFSRGNVLCVYPKCLMKNILDFGQKIIHSLRSPT